jgi:ABC-type lipoprotein export system ATPase subunit
MYEKWSLEESRSTHYGRYIAGPEGNGKSDALHFIACLARAMNWFIIYIERCDEWISESRNEIAAIHYFARKAAA